MFASRRSGELLVDRVVLGEEDRAAGGASPSSGRPLAARAGARARRAVSGAGEHRHQRVVQGGRLDRLGQQRVERRLPVLAHRRRRDEDEPRRVAAGHAARIASASSRPSMSGMNRSSRTTSNFSPALSQLERLARRARSPALDLPARELGDEDAPVRGVVVDDQSALAREVDGDAARRAPAGPTPAPSGSRTARWKVEPSPGTPVLSAVERAVHRLGEAPADGEPQAGAAVAPRDRRVGLAERLEEAAHLVLGDADAGVADVDRAAPTSSPCRLRRSTETTTSPFSVNLTAFDSRLSRIWRSRPKSPTPPAAGRRRPRRRARCPCRAAVGRDDVERALDAVARG